MADVGVAPSSWQRRLLASRSRFVGVSAGRRAGKTTLAAYQSVAWAMAGGTCWAIAPRYEQADLVWGLALVTARRLGVVDERRTSPAKGILTLATGGTVRRRSADAKGGNVGWGIDLATMDEAARCQRRVWEQDVRPTLNDRRGSAVWITTPGGYDWVYEYYARWERGEAPDWQWIRAPSWENLAIYPGGRDDPEILAAEREYRSAGIEALFRQEYGGEFVQLTGRVFPAWDPAVHVAPASTVRAGIVEWAIGYDWGWGHHSAFVACGRTASGAWRVAGEWGAPYAELGALWAGLESLARECGFTRATATIYPDPSRPEHAAELRRQGWTVQAAENSTTQKILHTASAMGRPGGFLAAAEATNTVRQLGTLHHQPPGVGSGDVRIVKIDDDYADCVMYAIASVESRPRAAVYAHGPR